MVEWMGRNFEVFPGFQKIPCKSTMEILQNFVAFSEYMNFNILVTWSPKGVPFKKTTTAQRSN